MNTDAPHLIKTRAERKLLLGKKVTKGLGAGSDIKVGEEAAMESKDEIKHMLSDANLVFMTCGLGGGTGTGSISTIAHEAKENGAHIMEDMLKDKKSFNFLSFPADIVSTGLLR